jgi:hypothetical protein
MASRQFTLGQSRFHLTRLQLPQHNAAGERFIQLPQAIRQDVGLTTLTVCTEIPSSLDCGRR